jgi:hypothetical protein
LDLPPCNNLIPFLKWVSSSPHFASNTPCWVTVLLNGYFSYLAWALHAMSRLPHLLHADVLLILLAPTPCVGPLIYCSKVNTYFCSVPPTGFKTKLYRQYLSPFCVAITKYLRLDNSSKEVYVAYSSWCWHWLPVRHSWQMSSHDRITHLWETERSHGRRGSKKARWESQIHFIPTCFHTNQTSPIRPNPLPWHGH